jgi:monoamine oxidase
MASLTSGVSPSVVIFDVIIVGGGLSGLYTGYRLSSQTPLRNWKLLEASDRLGGRLVNASATVSIDMGGAWIWPDHQPRIRALVSELVLSTFPQPGDSTSTRIVGGAVALIDRLSHRIREFEAKEMFNNGEKGNHVQRIELNSPVSICQKVQNADDFLVQLTTSSGVQYLARQVIFAVPPKIAADKIEFCHPISQRKRMAMSACRTWMAGVTKVSLVFPDRFWDVKSTNFYGLDAFEGPAFQAYDGSTKDDSVSALTFFTLIPPNDLLAQKDDDLVAKQVSSQLSQYWQYRGNSDYSKLAHAYRSHYVYRWPNEPFISDTDRPEQVDPHPVPSRALSESEWDGRLIFAGTEADRQSPGVMEGAIGAAEWALTLLFKMN